MYSSEQKLVDDLESKKLFEEIKKNVYSEEKQIESFNRGDCEFELIIDKRRCLRTAI